MNYLNSRRVNSFLLMRRFLFFFISKIDKAQNRQEQQLMEFAEKYISQEPSKRDPRKHKD